MVKKAIIVFVVTILLVACGDVKTHKNVDEELAKDSIQVMDRILENVEKDISIEDVDNKDNALFESYFNKYMEDDEILKPSKYSGANNDVYIFTGGTLVTYSKGISLDSDKEKIKENYEYMMKAIETGLSVEERIE